MPDCAITSILTAFDEGRPALLVTGRSLLDLGIDEEDEHLRPLLEILRRQLRQRFGIHLATYSLAAGFDWNPSSLSSDHDRRLVESALSAHGLLDIPQDEDEIVRVIRGIASLSRTPTGQLQWSDGQELHFAFLFEFSEHLAPGGVTNGTQTDAQVVAIELAHLTAQSLALRASGNLVLFTARDGMVDELVTRALHQVRLTQPNRDEKLAFITVASSLYSESKLADGLSPEIVAHLTANTPNRGLEAILRASHRTGRPIEASALTADKAQAIEELSEGTLTLLDSSRASGIDLVGRNVAVPLRALRRYANGLARANSSIPASVVLVGPPGTAKTVMALLVAREAGVAALQLHSPKDALVGGTERKAGLQQELLSEWTPNVGFVDEITEALPLERSDFDGDSGASRAVMASLLSVLSDESRRGHSLIIGTTNCPWRMGAAMRSRFRFIPVLFPLSEDFPAIIESTLRQIDSSLRIDPNHADVKRAAEIFYHKGASPRHIRSALSHIYLIEGKLDESTVLQAANDFAGETDLTSAAYADLWAIKTASSLSELPWASNPSEYPFPPHLQGIIDPATGLPHRDRLDAKIEELRPRSNV